MMKVLLKISLLGFIIQIFFVCGQEFKVDVGDTSDGSQDFIPSMKGDHSFDSHSSVWGMGSPTEDNSRHSHSLSEGPHELSPYFHNHENSTTITAQLGSTAMLDCRVNRLRDKTVSWVRRDANAIKLLTYGLQTYSNDARYSLNLEHPSNWKLQVKYTQKRDEGTYECQISTHPPKVLLIHLNIVAPVVEIIDERGSTVQEKLYKTGSTLELRCTISQMPQAQTFILWRHGDHMLNYDTSRGGISVKTDMSSSVIVSTLFIANATPADSGNYTCSLGDVASGSVFVHVLNGKKAAVAADSVKTSVLRDAMEGEHPAAMHQGCACNEFSFVFLVIFPAVFGNWFDILCYFERQR